MKFIILVSLVSFTTAINLIGRTQSVAVRGTLRCEGKPLSGIKVRLMESDNSFLPGVFDTDDVMATGKTDSSGQFTLSGSSKEITSIEPYLAISHDCNDGIKPGSRVVRINIPGKYVSSGSNPKKTYEAGNMELAGKFPGEKRSGLFGRK